MRSIDPVIVDWEREFVQCRGNTARIQAPVSQAASYRELTMTISGKNTIALIQGDPAGIGPELLAKLLCDNEVRAAANLLVIGAPGVFARGEAQTGLTVENVRHEHLDACIEFLGDEVLHLDLSLDGIGDLPVAQVSAKGRPKLDFRLAQGSRAGP